MSITVSFPCGHNAVVVSDTTDTAPICAVCGERRVWRVTAPPPRFSGVCRGPSATTTALAPVVVACAPAGPLPLKDPDHA